MKYIKDEKVLYEKVCGMMLKHMITAEGEKIKINPINVIESVEFDPVDGGDNMDKPSYWVYLHNGYLTECGRGCHTIHEDTLGRIKEQLRDVIYDKRDLEARI